MTGFSDNDEEVKKQGGFVKLISTPDCVYIPNAGQVLFDS